MDLVAYLLQDWQHLGLTLSLLALCVCATWKAMPESPRYLIEAGQVDRLTATVKLATETSRRLSPHSSKLMSNWVTETTNRRLHDDVTLGSLQGKGKGSTLPSPGSPGFSVVTRPSVKPSLSQDRFRGLFKGHCLIRNTLTLCFIMTALNLCYQGMPKTLLEDVSNVYIDYLVIQLAQVPGFLLALVTLDHLGRKTVIVASLILTSIGTVFSGVAYLGEDSAPVLIILALIGECMVPHWPDVMS